MHERAFLVCAALLALQFCFFSAPVRGSSSLPPAAQTSSEERYLAIYVAINDAERLERAGDFKGAVEEYQDSYDKLTSLRSEHPDWEEVLVRSRLEDCRAKINELNVKVDFRGAPTSSPGSVQPSNPALPSPAPHLPLMIPVQATVHYPWKTDIITGVFWIGEVSPASGWDQNWMRENGGSDDPADEQGYASSTHASQLNPFYVALPFNDLADPEKARRWVPPNWFKPSQDGKSVSACHDRWVEIKSTTGRTCFALWEDVGPGGADDAEYVFGTGRPENVNHIGLSVSPAVAKYLGIRPSGTAITSWRFVDNPDVLPGMWLKYDEQAIIFRALKAQAALKKDKVIPTAKSAPSIRTNDAPDLP
jgi:hypothetical protein